MTKSILLGAFALCCMAPVWSAENPRSSVLMPDTMILWEAPAKITPFCLAIVKGDYKAVQKFISLGADVNEKSLGKTPAVFAARYNQAEILTLLLQHGADLTIPCDNGLTAKKQAELSNAQEALQVINAHLAKKE